MKGRIPKRKEVFCFVLLVFLTMSVSGCEKWEGVTQKTSESSPVQVDSAKEDIQIVSFTDKITQLEEGFSAVRYDGDYGFDEFLAQEGASSDSEVIMYLAENLLSGIHIDGLSGEEFGCSTLLAHSAEGETLFGRNFDWENCEAMAVAAYPENGYSSISTVNMDFITQNIDSGVVGAALQLEEIKILAALYAPLDGMNEQGLAISVNMIQDTASIEQDTEKPDITTTTAVRLLLDKAANVEEALKLLETYDLHGSMGMMIHFALADREGRSVVVEYIHQKMVVTETPVVTNFYLSQGEKYGVGTQQSHERYEILMQRLRKSTTMEVEEVRDALDSVSKDNFEEFASTEWSVVFNLHTGEARYYHRENYQKSYSFQLE